MSDQFYERDWKVFRALSALGLERYCRRVVDEPGRLAADESRTNYERHLAISKMVHHRDKELASAFGDQRRSRAIEQLAQMRWLELVTDEEFARLSDETRAYGENLLHIWRK